MACGAKVWPPRDTLNSPTVAWVLLLATVVCMGVAVAVVSQSQSQPAASCYRWSRASPHDWNGAGLPLCGDVPFHVFDFDFDHDLLAFAHFQKTGGATFCFKLATIVPPEPTPTCFCHRDSGRGRGKDLDVAGLSRYIGDEQADNMKLQSDSWQKCRCYRAGHARPPPPLDETTYGGQWLSMWYSTHFPCGVHAPLQELRRCLPEVYGKWIPHRTLRETTQYAPLPLPAENDTGRLHLFTLLRHPKYRFTSEFVYVHRYNALKMWKRWELVCGETNGRTRVAWTDRCERVAPGFLDVATCPEEEMEEGVCPEHYRITRQRWNTFLGCPINPAINRLTHSLMDDAIGCDSRACVGDVCIEEFADQMLESAKQNLVSLPFFGLSEFRKESELLMEHSLGIRYFDRPADDRELHNPSSLNLTSADVQHMLDINWMDVQLWEFAQEVFWSRYMSTDLPRPDRTTLPDW